MTIIQNATIVNEGEKWTGSVLIEDGHISQVSRDREILHPGAKVVDAEGMMLLPGIIDDHVHFRDPGLTHKATMHTESMAAAAGGVTSVLDMPNVVPQTTTNALLRERQQLGQETMHVNHAFFLGATNDNLEEIKSVDLSRCPGIKLFMGSSTGNMLVDKEEQLMEIFRQSPGIIMTHCEDTERINQRMAEYKARYGEDPEVKYHPEIRDAEACYLSSALAVKMAQETGARLHLAHVTTARELSLGGQQNITLEVCVPHLLYTDEDYSTLGTRIKCNPAVKTAEDREALRKAVLDGRITTVGTDHAPHLLSEKQGGAAKAVSGMPMLQFSLVSMLSLFPADVVVRLMAHNPATLFGIEGRGFIREGYKADLVLVRRRQHTISKEEILSLCQWSPREGDTVNYEVASTWVNGQLVWDGTRINTDIHGEALHFTL